MKRETLESRIQKAEEKISKKEALIEKRFNSIEKKHNALRKLGIQNPETKDEDDFRYMQENGQDDLFDDIYWIYCDIHGYNQSIEDARRAIKETKEKLEDYHYMLDELNGLEKIHRSLPEVLNQMEAQLVETWDAWDKRDRDNIKNMYSQMDDYEFWKQYKQSGYDKMNQTDDDIHKKNVQAAEVLVVDLYNRVKEITGENIKGWNNISATVGTHGFTVLNGRVYGDKGSAEVESIYAGGWNIQRLHIRVLVKEA